MKQEIKPRVKSIQFLKNRMVSCYPFHNFRFPKRKLGGINSWEHMKMDAYVINEKQGNSITNEKKKEIPNDKSLLSSEQSCRDVSLIPY
jgi:hypothetical protein